MAKWKVQVMNSPALVVHGEIYEIHRNGDLSVGDSIKSATEVSQGNLISAPNATFRSGVWQYIVREA